jgi:hypothetical protein
MKKLSIVAIALVLCGALTAHAQVPVQDPDKVVIKPEGYEAPLEERPLSELTFAQRLRFGGGLSNLSFGNPTSVGLSPVLGYMLSDKVIVGAGVTYQYYSLRLFNGRLTNNLFAYRGFARHSLPFLQGLVQNAFAQAEYEQFESLSDGRIRYRPQMLAGVGFSTGGRFSLNVMALYDFNYRAGFDPTTGLSYSPYGSPIVLRVSFF